MIGHWALGKNYESQNSSLLLIISFVLLTNL